MLLSHYVQDHASFHYISHPRQLDRALIRIQPHVIISDLKFGEDSVISIDHLKKLQARHGPNDLAIFIRSGSPPETYMDDGLEVWGALTNIGDRSAFEHAMNLAYRHFIEGDSSAKPQKPIIQWPQKETVQLDLLRLFYAREGALRGD